MSTRKEIKREYPDAPLVAVGALIIDQDKILLVKRKNEPGQGLWSIPGGVVELGERVEDAVKREVKEETGMTIKVERLLTTIDRIVKDREGRVQFHYVIIDYLACTSKGTLRASTDAEEAKWIHLDDVKNLPATSVLVSLIDEAKRKGWLDTTAPGKKA
jgi:8-oxo-dGTP diphosphatase